MSSADGEEKVVKVCEWWHRCSLAPQHSWLSGTCLLFPPALSSRLHWVLIPSLPLWCILPSPASRISSLGQGFPIVNTQLQHYQPPPVLIQEYSGQASPGLQAMHRVMAHAVSLYNRCANYSLMEKYPESLGELLPERAGKCPL